MSKVSRRFQFASTQVEKKLYNYIEAISLLKKIYEMFFINANISWRHYLYAWANSN